MYWDPFEYMRRIQEEMDEAFDRFFSRTYRRPMLASGERTVEILKSISLTAEALKIQHALELLETQDTAPLYKYFNAGCWN
mgnify:CR=1 FL=1